MPRKPELSVEKRAAIVAEYNNGISSSDLAKKYSCHRNTILYQVTKEKNRGNVKSVPGRGRKRKTSKKDDKQIIRSVKRNPAVTIKTILNDFNLSTDNKISRTTIARRLKENKIKTYVVQKKPFISSKNKCLRLQFALAHKEKPLEFWRNILWTDECAFSLDGTYGRRFYYSTPQEKQKRAVHKPTRHSNGGKIMIWGCMSYNGIGPIVKLPDKVNQGHYMEILNDCAIVAGDKLIGNNFMLQHDNAPIHTGNKIKEFLSVVGQNVLTWPPQSPDLNVIENLWHHVKLNIPNQIGKSADQAWKDIINVWSQIPVSLLQNLIDSMPQRLQEVIEAKGGNTSY